MTLACDFCQQDISAHDPVFVEELRDGERVHSGRFCNYACLSAYIADRDLTVGTSCRIDQ